MDDQLILTAERLRDELTELRADLRSRYRLASRQVTADDVKQRTARAAETWMVELAVRRDITSTVPSDYLANLNVHFQRLLTASEHASQRNRYDAELQAILKRFTLDLIIPLKQARSHERPQGPPGARLQASSGHRAAPAPAGNGFVPSAFVGHSFAPSDRPVAECVVQGLSVLGIVVVTGEKPKADRISEKVKKLIDGQHIFVGVFTRRDKIARKNEWTTATWVIDEKAYAVGKQKKLLLLKEDGVGSIGGIQGDYEFLEFARDALDQLLIRLIQNFDLVVQGFRV